jgi:hypothetical protein
MLCLCRPAKRFPFTKQHGQPNIFFRLIAGSSGANASKRATSSGEDFSQVEAGLLTIVNLSSYANRRN